MSEETNNHNWTSIKPETAWRRNGDWKARYSKLYSSRGMSVSNKEEHTRISFMSNDATPNATLLTRLRSSRQDCSSSSATTSGLTALLTERSECYGTRQGSQESEAKQDIHDSPLLDILRSQSNELKDQPLALPNCDILDDNPNMNEECIHGYSYNTRIATERSTSRSRVSRISTRRDMDIPSILAYTASSCAPICLGIPAFQKVEEKPVHLPRWSIRRSMCPVCSQKWKDKSSITNVKYSGLKKNSPIELPSIKAPARLKTSVTTGYVPRPVPVAEDKEASIAHGGFRNSSATWQLTRARRYRTPKPQLPPPEATAPPGCSAPTARKDLDLRVSRFLSDEFRCS